MYETVAQVRIFSEGELEPPTESDFEFEPFSLLLQLVVKLIRRAARRKCLYGTDYISGVASGVGATSGVGSGTGVASGVGLGVGVGSSGIVGGLLLTGQSR